jgi:hypothetical protein
VTVKIELVGGPGDGALVEVPSATKLWVLPVAEQDIRRFQAMEGDLKNDVVPHEIGTYAYGITERQSVASGARVFEYIGERVTS